MCLWVGTKLKFKPGIVMGGRNLVHECALSRAIGYYLEPLIVLGLFAKKPLNITLQGSAFITVNLHAVYLVFFCSYFVAFLLVFL